MYSHSTTLNYLITGTNEDGPWEDEVEVETTIEWEGEPETPAIVTGPADNWDPGDGGYFDIIKITVTKDAPDAKLKKGEEIEVEQVRETEKAIEEEVISRMNDDCYEPEPDYDDYVDDPAVDYIYDPGY